MVDRCRTQHGFHHFLPTCGGEHQQLMVDAKTQETAVTLIDVARSNTTRATTAIVKGPTTGQTSSSSSRAGTVSVAFGARQTCDDDDVAVGNKGPVVSDAESFQQPKIAPSGSVAQVTTSSAKPPAHTTAANPAPFTVLFSTIGFGIDRMRKSPAMNPTGFHPEDATQAAIRAVRDALERCGMMNSPSSSSTHKDYELHLRLGVPSKGATAKSIQPMDVKLSRVSSTLLSWNLAEGCGGAVRILPVDVVVGGLAVPREGGGQQPSPPSGTGMDIVTDEECHAGDRKSIVVVVACVTLRELGKRDQYEHSDQPGMESTKQCPRSQHTVARRLENPLQQTRSGATTQTQSDNAFRSSDQHAVASTTVTATPTSAASLMETKVEQETSGPESHSQKQRSSRTDRGELSTTPDDVEMEETRMKTLVMAEPVEEVISDVSNSTAHSYSQESHLRLSRSSTWPHAEQNKSFHRTTSMDMLARVSAEMRNEEPSTIHSSSAAALRLMAATALCKDQEAQQHQQQEANSGEGAVNNYNYKKLPPGTTPKKNKRLFVKHTYHDYSQEVPRADELDLVGATAPVRTPNAAFPLKLHEILVQIETDGLDDIVGWLPHGRSFKIHKQKEFVDTILPNYFVMTKKSSFLRQLNLYNFNRLSGISLDQGSYYHEKFLRGMKFLSRRMQRQKVNGNGIRAAGNPDEEPNLRNFPNCPLPPQQLQQQDGASSSACTAEAEDDNSEAIGGSENDTSDRIVQQTPERQQVVESETSNSQTKCNGKVDNVSSAGGSSKLHDAAATRAAAAVAASQVAQSSYESFFRHSLGLQASFPLKLQRILDKLEADGNESTISWISHGRAFMVRDVERFVSELMPVYFNQTKYSSFQRQLHMYNFQRITAGPDKGAYHHALFRRGYPELSTKMQRTRVNGKGTRRPGNPLQEPDLYSLSPLPRIPNGTKIEIPAISDQQCCGDNDDGSGGSFSDE